jgi:hypothetical protein
LQLQKQVYLSEAEIHNDNNIKPLIQTLDEIKQDFLEQIFLKDVIDETIIIGSVRVYQHKDNTYWQ